MQTLISIIFLVVFVSVARAVDMTMGLNMDMSKDMKPTGRVVSAGTGEAAVTVALAHVLRHQYPDASSRPKAHLLHATKQNLFGVRYQLFTELLFAQPASCVRR